MSDINDYRRHLCTDCGVRLYNGHRARKHEAKTGHKTAVNVRAERAVQKYRNRRNPNLLGRIDERMNHVGYIFDE